MRRPAGRSDLDMAALLFAVDPRVGVCLHGPADPLRDAWLDRLRGCLPTGGPWRRLPVDCPVEVLRGGLDISASLRGGRPMRTPGLAAALAGGVLVAPGAERLRPETAAGLVEAVEAGVGVVALAESPDDDEVAPALLAEHLTLAIDLRRRHTPARAATPAETRAVAAARVRLPRVTVSDDALRALTLAAMACGLDSLRVPIQAVRVAKAAAALARRDRVGAGDVALASRLCLGPRARLNPADPEQQPASTERDPAAAAASQERPTGPGDRRPSSGMDTVAVAAARACLPAALLEVPGPGGSSRRVGHGRAAERRPRPTAASHGRPVAARPGRPRHAGDVDLFGTLCAAMPWQAARGRPDGGRLRLHGDDLRVSLRRRPRLTTTVFAVDASGSAAHGRLAEAKGAVELLLAECYVRRDAVALLAFREADAALLLPPTRSLARARRELADLPGGGGTPLAAGLDLALSVAQRAARDGRTALVAVLTDGRANVARDGRADRARAEAEGLAAAQAIRAAGFRTLLIDIAVRRAPMAARLAEALGARYVPLPRAEATAIAAALRPDRGAP